MTISRRSFLKGSGLCAVRSVVAPALLGNPFVRQALADTIGDRFFVSIYLDGGNDGFNTVIPVDDGGATMRAAYDAARETGTDGLNISPAQLAGTLIGTDPGTGCQLGLHPALTGLKALYDRKQRGLTYTYSKDDHDRAQRNRSAVSAGRSR